MESFVGGIGIQKPDSFSTHTSACAPFQHRRASDSDVEQTSPFWMPTGISIQNVFEGARRRSMSSATSVPNNTSDVVSNISSSFK
ncbi:hypothetical protein BC941DRAFT_472431 [Chlamydoabsidia padenii]|nr:hypothetical protein BC941DRAFT_472431 [Chlamydoabsidia padenii]